MAIWFSGAAMGVLFDMEGVVLRRAGVLSSSSGAAGPSANPFDG